MQRHIFAVKSITYAIKGRDFLRKKGIKSYVERKTNTKGNAECGYVIVAYDSKDKIFNELTGYGIKITEINSAQ